MKNFNNFTNLMNGVLKKGPSGEVKRNRLEEGSNEHPMSIHSASIEHPLGSGGNQVETSIKPCIWKYAAVILCVLILGVGQILGAITPKTISDADGEVYLVTPSTMSTYYDSGNGWVTNGSGGAISSSSYYTAKSGSNNTNYINPDTETSGTKGTGSGITLKTADDRSARFYFTGAVKISAFIAITGSSRTATIDVYKVSDDTKVGSATTESYGGSGYYEKIEVTGLTSSVSYYAKVTATNDLCLYAVKIFAPSVPTTWYVKGGWNEWGTSDNFNGSGTTITRKVNITTAGLYEFKIWNNSGGDGTWYGNGGNIGCNVTDWAFSTSDGNCKFFASETGKYIFSFNTSTKKLSVTYPTAQKKVYYKNTDSWGTVAVYRFKGGINNGWPGTIVTETETMCTDGPMFYTYADPGTTVIFNNNDGGSQTGNMAVSASTGKYSSGTSDAWTAFSTYTISFAAGSGSGSMSSISSIACGEDKAVTANSFTAPSGYQFSGWKANVDVKVGGATKTAGTLLDDKITIQEVGSNITLTAQWELIPTYDVTYDANSGGTGTTASQTGNLNGAQVTTRANGFTPNSGKKFKWWNTASGGGGEDFYPGEKVTIDGADVALYAQWETVASNQEFWTPIGASASSGSAISITEGDMSISSGGVTDAADINVDLTANATKVSKYSSTAKHAKVLAIKDDDKYIQVSFTDGSPINKLWLGTTTNNTDKKNLVVLYSTTADFSTGEYEKVTVKVNGYEQTSKAVFDFSPSTTDKYLYARIYRKISTAVYSQTGGDGATARIYSIKAQKGASCVAPTSVTIDASSYYFSAGDEVTFTSTVTGGSGTPVSYQWKKNGEDIDGATSSSYTIASAAVGDAGSYTLTVTKGSCSTTSEAYKLKCFRMLLKESRNGSDIDYYPLVMSDATHGSVSVSLTGGRNYGFGLTNGIGYYGNTGTMNQSNCTNWTLDDAGSCEMTTSTKSATYTFNFDFTNGDEGDAKVSVVYPAGDQAADKVIYWDNSVLNWASAPWYRIGKGTHNTKTQMTLVSGTANLYKVTTAEYNGFEYWHIANNEGEGTGNVFWTKDSDPTTNEEITNAMGFEGSPVSTAAVTITPKADYHGTGTSSDNNNCEFYEYDTQNSMKTDAVTIDSYSNGTITVNYTNTANVASSFTSGTENLAHTVILTSITAVANDGYSAGAITINGNAYAANYVVTGATTIAATFSPIDYTVTLNNQSATTAGTPNVTATYNANTNLTSAITSPAKTGYTFGGYYTETGGHGLQLIDKNGDWNASITGYTDASKNWIHIGNVELYARWIACTGYSFHSASSGAYPWESTCFTQVGSSHIWQIENYDIPSATSYYVGYQEDFWSSGLGDGALSKSVEKLWTATPANIDDTEYWDGAMFLVPASGDTEITPSSFACGQATGARGALLITDNVHDNNLYVRFKPNGYGLTYAAGVEAFSYVSDHLWQTDIVTLTAADIAGTFKVGLATASAGTYVDCALTSEYDDDAMNSHKNALVSEQSYPAIPDLAAGQEGRFVIWDNSANQWYLSFLPVYTVQYNGNGSDGGSAPAAATKYRTNETPTVLANTYTRTGYTFSGWNTADDGNGTPYAAGASLAKIGANVTLYAQWTVNTYDVTHTFTNVSRSSGGAGGTNAATYGTDYSVTVAASSGFALPSTITVTIGGSTKTAGTEYTWDKSTGVVTVDGDYILGAVVITITGEEEDTPCFQMAADASAGSEKELSSGESITAGSKNCTTLSGGTAVFRNGASSNKMKVQKPSPYGWYFGSSNDSIVITLTGSILQAGSVIKVSGNAGSSGCGFTFNASTSITKKGASGEMVDSTYTVKAGDSHLIGKNVIVVKRATGSATRMYSLSFSNCQSATPCTTPTLPSLSNQAGCSYSAWNATPTNASTITSAGESISYSWKKGATEKATTASYTPDADGTDYTVTVTVSKAGSISTSVTSSALTATKYGNPTVTSPSDAEYEVGESASNLSVTATPDHGESLTYQWYSNTAKSTSSPTPTVLENCTTSTYKPSTAATGTTYYFCKVSGGCADVYSSIATVTVSEVSCFKFKAGTTKAGTGWDVPNNGAITTALWTDGSQVLTGGTLTNTSGSSLGGNASYGLVYAASGNKQVTLALTGTNRFGVGTVISITGYSNNSKEACGFTVNGNSMTPATYTPGSAEYTKFTQTYTVSASDGIDGETSITIDAATSIRVYLNAITITGCEEVTGYTISFAGNGNTGGSMTDVTEIEEGDDVALSSNAFTKNGYTFANWTADVAVTVNSATVTAGDPIADEATIQSVTSDITLTAQWTPNDYTITYHLNGASWASSAGVASYTVGTGATLPLAGAMTNTGYTFDGWKDNSGLTGSSVTTIGTSEYGNKEYWAKWTENTYTVTYNANGGSGSTSSTNGHYVTVANNGFTYASHVFAGWNTKSGGDGYSYGEGDEIELTANMTLYAQWATDYDISWDASPKLSGSAATPNLGGGNYTIKASVSTWTGTLTTSMISSETSGVTITSVAVDNSSSPKTITATFNVGASVAGDKISFTLDVPAAGVYGAKSSTEDFDIDRCEGAGGGGTTIFKAKIKSGMSAISTDVLKKINSNTSFTTDNYLSELVGGTLTLNISTAGHIQAGSDTTIRLTDDAAYWTITLTETTLQAGDIIKYYVSSNNPRLQKTSGSFDATTDIVLERSNWNTIVVPNGMIGASTLYLKRPGKNTDLGTIEIYRPDETLLYIHVKDGMTAGNLPTAETQQTTSNNLAVVSGGTVYAGATTSGHIQITETEYKLANNTGYLKLALPKALAEGDKLYFNSSANYQIAITSASPRSDAIYTTKKIYTIPKGSALIGESTIYLWYYSSSTTTIKTLAVVRPGSGSSSVTPTLTWSPALITDGDWHTDHLEKETGDADFTYTVTQDKNSLGAITYASSNTDVATVNASGKVHIAGAAGNATITATMAESGCYAEATASYNITVVDNCEDVAGTIGTEDLGCDGIQMTVTGHTTSGATVSYQWYKDGATIGGATSAIYTATTAGEYYVVVTNTGDGHCAMASTNTITVEATETASASKIVNSWYVKNGRRTPDVALVQTEDATGFYVKIGDDKIWDEAHSVTTGFAGCGFYLGTDGIIYLKGQQADGSEPSGLTAGDVTLKFTATACGGNSGEVSITIHKQTATTYKEVAFVVDGTKEGAWDAVTSGHADGTVLYEYLDSVGTAASARKFQLYECNIYKTVDEQAIREYYSQFDAILITDNPDTGTKIGKKSCVNAFGTMVDIRPILTMEAWVSKLANWKAKGVSGNPESPNPRQYGMKLQCKDHAIFKGLSVGSNVKTETIEGVDYWTVLMVDSTKSPYSGVAYNSETSDKPALQGFAASDVSGLLLLGQISNGTLYAGVERQEEPAARLMLLGLNAKALPNALTDEGKIVIKNALSYLLETDMEQVDDCSNYFTGASSSDWNTATNWSKGVVPNSPTNKARILRPCVISSGSNIQLAEVDIATDGASSKIAGAKPTGKLTIEAGAILTVGGKIRAAEAPYFNTGDLKPTEEVDLVVNNTSSSNQAALIFNNDAGDTKATVNLYSIGRKVSETYQYQYLAIPMQHLPVNPSFAGLGIYTYVWLEASGWERRGYYDDVYAFEGLGITTSETTASQYEMKGTLASTVSQEIPITADGKRLNLIGNSWTAPIQISKLEKSDFGDASESIEQTVYIYCTGNGNATTAGTTETAGQWLAIPFSAAGFGAWDGLKVIPAMQAFQIKTSGAGTLTLDYDKHVRGGSTDLTSKLRAPKRTAAYEDVELMRIRVADSKTHTDLYLFEGEQFSDEFDNGWEANYRVGTNESAKLYARVSTGVMSVAAMSDLEGTPVYFIPGQETEYTFTFGGAGMGYYLNDMKLKKSTLISADETYSFLYEKGDAPARFYISRTPIDAPQTPTGVDNTHSGSTKVRKVIINDKVYIFRGGHMYSVDGRMVK